MSELSRRGLLGLIAATAASPRVARAQPSALAAALEQARAMPRLHALIVARDGEIVVAERFRGPALETPVNIKSASKSIVSALVGKAIAEGIIPGVEAPIGPLLGRRIPRDADPRVAEITIQDLLTMRAGLERTSGANYGAWVTSGNWVDYILTRPFVDEPGGAMLYSTGSTHLLSAILTLRSGRSTLELARAWLGRPLGIAIPSWDRDPQGIYLGGNNMALSPRAMLRFGELYRQAGLIDGRRVLPESWIEASWQPRTRSRFNGHEYGYGWFTTELAGETAHYAWGYGGQMLYVLPVSATTVVMTSDPDPEEGRDGYPRRLHRLLEDAVLPALRDMPQL